MRGNMQFAEVGERFALALIACALLLRIAVPGGWMPGEQGRWIELCTAQGSLTAFVDARGKLHHGDPADAEKAKQHCAFAGLGGALDRPAAVEPPTVAPAYAPLPTRIASASVGRGLAAPPPPSTGPPSIG